MIGMTTLFAMLAGVFGPVVGKSGTPERKAKRRPVGEELRDMQNPHQIARFEAAAVKRGRKARKLENDTNQSWNRNYCHHDGFRKLVGGPLQAIAPASLNPFFVAK